MDQPIMYSPPPRVLADNILQAFHLLAEARYVLRINSAHIKRMGEKLNMDEFTLEGLTDQPTELAESIQKFFDQVEGRGSKEDL